MNEVEVVFNTPVDRDCLEIYVIKKDRVYSNEPFTPLAPCRLVLSKDGAWERVSPAVNYEPTLTLNGADGDGFMDALREALTVCPTCGKRKGRA